MEFVQNCCRRWRWRIYSFTAFEILFCRTKTFVCDGDLFIFLSFYLQLTSTVTLFSNAPKGRLKVNLPEKGLYPVSCSKYSTDQA